MAETAWLSCGDTSMLSSTLRKYKFTSEHFQLNSYTQIRVYLVVQFTSKSMIACITEYCENNEVGIDGYTPMLELLAKVDQLIYIVNTTGMRNGKEKGCTPIDSPEHGHISELLGIVKFFEDW